MPKTKLTLTTVLCVTVAMACALSIGCLPVPEDPSAASLDVRANLNLSSPQATFETMVGALKTGDPIVRLACMTTRAQNQETGVMALNLMDIAIKAPVGGDKYLTLLNDHGLTQVYVNQAMASSGADPANRQSFTEKLGAKIKDRPKFHYEAAKMVPRPPLPELEFISASEENGRMIGRIKVDGKNALMVFREVEGYWLVDGQGG